jgi:hypothetical protein
MGIIDTIFERIGLIVMMSGSYAFDKDGNAIEGVNIRYSTVLTPLEQTEYGREARRLAKRREKYEARRLKRAKERAENPQAVKEKRRQDYLKYGKQANEAKRERRRNNASI